MKPLFILILNRFIPVALLAALLGSAVQVTPVYAAAIVVNTDADNIANDGKCTLREAITAAVSDHRSGSGSGECAAGSAGVDGISFANNYTITVDSQLPIVSSAITITGKGAANTIIRALGGANVRLFQVSPTGSLTLDQVTVRDGSCWLDSCAVFDGILPNAGGGVYNTGTLTVTNSTFSNNVALDSGGAIHNTGTLTLINSIFTENGAPAHNVGGGTIYNTGTLVMTDSSILNSGSYFGGGVLNRGTMSVTNGTFAGNGGRAGGAIYNTGDLTITGSTFVDNVAQIIGGGAILSDGTLTVTNSTFSENIVSTGYGGAIRATGIVTLDHSSVTANNYAGIHNSGTMNLTDSTVSGNTGGGGIMNIGALHVSRSTIAGNSGGSEGGGIYNFSGGTLDVTNSTITGNSGWYAGGINNVEFGTTTVNYTTIAGNTAAGPFGGGISNIDAATSILKNTIVSNNGSANCYGTINNGGYNLDSGTTCGFGSNFGSLSGADPMLKALADNGGPTQTMALLDGSPAIDAGNPVSCPATDQRGVPRPISDCDLGAYEYDDNYPLVSHVNRANNSPTNAVTVNFTVGFTEPVTGVDVGDFELFTSGVIGASILSASGSGSIYTVTVNTGSGDGTIRLDVMDADSIVDAAGNPLGGVGPDNGAFNSGDEYAIMKSVIPPGQPVLLAPAAGTLVDTLQPVFDWQDSDPAAYYYQIQIASDSTFGKVVLGSANVTTSTFTSDWYVFQPGSLFYWRVKAFNVLGDASAWSAVWTFKTPLMQPTLVSPTDGAELLTDRPAFDWDVVNGASQYNLQVSAVGNFRTLLVNATTSGSEYTVTKDLPQNKTLYWRVRAKSAVVTGPWSLNWSFLSGNPPSVPVLISPPNNALVRDYTPFLNWNNSRLPAGTFKHYEIQVADNNDFSSPVINTTTTPGDITDSDFTPESDLASNTRFYWRVRAINTINSVDHTSGWSAVRTFRTVVLPPTGLTVIPNGLRPSFDWNDASGPITSYTIQISTSANFNTLLVNSTAITSTYAMLKDLPAGKTLYWRVRVNGANGPSAWTTSQLVTP